LAAYECVLKGNALPWNDPVAAAEATRLFAKAIEIDPRYGFAHATMAAIYLHRWKDDLGSSNASLNEAYRLAKRAVELESNDSTCFAILGLTCLFRRSFDVALQHMRRALEINPNNQWNIADMGIVLTHAGQPEAALACFDRARAVDPYFDPPWCWFSMGMANMVLHRYREALVAFERLPARKFRAAALMAGCHARLADAEQAATLMGECLRSRPEIRLGAYMAKEPFRDPADAAHIAECLEMAGLPV
jgi:tetratricopeptide (TPR) repeat protein